MLAPLAGIGNWFVRLQAKRYGAGLAVSRDDLELRDPLRQPQDARRAARRAPRRGAGGDPALRPGPGDHALRRGRRWRSVGADILDLNMGCPVPKVMKTGAGAALIKDPDTAVAVAQAAREGSGLPVTVKLRASVEAGRRRRARAGAAARGRGRRRRASRSTRAAPPCATRACPTTTSPRSSCSELPVPVIVSGGMEGAEHIRWVFEHTGLRGGHAGAWRTRKPVAVRAGAGRARRGSDAPTRSSRSGTGSSIGPRSISGPIRAARYLRKFHPWYVERIGAPKAVQDALQRAETLDEQRAVLLLSCAPSAPLQA